MTADQLKESEANLWQATDKLQFISSYVVAKDNREKVDILELNAEVKKKVVKTNTLRADIDVIIKEIES